MILESTASPHGTTTRPLRNTTLPRDDEYKKPVGVADNSSSKKNIYIAVFVVAGAVTVAAFGVGFYYCHRRLKLAKDAKSGLVYSAKPSETGVQYKAHDPSVGGSSSSYGSTVPLLRQRSLRSRLGSNLTQVSEVEMPLDEKWEIDREHVSLLGVLGEGAFGRVMKAEVIGMPNMPFRFDVAVKMLKGELCINFIFTAVVNSSKLTEISTLDIMSVNLSI